MKTFHESAWESAGRDLVCFCAPLARHVAYTLAILAGDPAPIGSETTGELVDAIHTGSAVLVGSDRRQLRNHARAEILAMLGPVRRQA